MISISLRKKMMFKLSLNRNFKIDLKTLLQNYNKDSMHVSNQVNHKINADSSIHKVHLIYFLYKIN
jgi:hypothetical protein